MTKQCLSKHLQMLGEEEDMPVLMEKSRKLLTHFLHILERSGCSKDEYLFQTLFLCETAIQNSTVAERAGSCVGGILKTLLVLVKRDYVCQNAVNECLATIISILRVLDNNEVINLPDEIKQQFSHLTGCWNRMENMCTMKAIVCIFYEYLSKYEHNDKVNAFKQATQEFTDLTGKLESIIQWTPESFEHNCHLLVNNISGKKYFSLAAKSAVLGEKELIPLPGSNVIYIEWNHNPAELAFKAAFASATENPVQVNIALSDIESLHTIEDMLEPRVECSYGRIVIVGDSMAAYNLRINAANNDELRGLLQHLKNRIPLDKIFIKLLNNGQGENTMKNAEVNVELDFSNEEHLEDVLPVIVIPEESSAENKENLKIFVQHISPLKTTKRSFKFIDLSDDEKKSAPGYDPYDIAQVQKEDRDQKRAQKHANGRGASMECKRNSAKSTAVPINKRPACIVSSTPAKRSRAAAIQSTVDGIDAISSIYCLSDDAKSDSSDVDYVPYVMLSRKNKQTTKSRPYFPRTSKMAKRIVAVKRSTASTLTQTNTTLKAGARKMNGNKTTRKSTAAPVQISNTPSLPPETVDEVAFQLSRTNGIADSATPFSSNGSQRVRTGKATTNPAPISLDTTASSLRSSGRNNDETLQMGLVPFKSATNTLPRATKVAHITMHSVLHRILSLERCYDDQMRFAANEAQALANKGSTIFTAFKEKYERSLVLRAKWEKCYQEMMDIAAQGIHSEIIAELQSKQKEAEKRDEKLLQDLNVEKNNLKATFQTNR